ncbi:hypothetical protein [Hymenobacter cheonanensis]|uniref:hypothetical protein n=1 Tax=Hymenobacter sp. CA2-7 TaxID=3063993 RepID=UPI0027123A68|nr:hypothetical protein [Hymenobacter sp. CA2-7]MDO7885224.1 hypothetical protein [Hymenobacter sp. CA2-7]
MKNLLFLLAFSALATTSVAQKIKVEGELITVDGQPYARIERDGCGALNAGCMYYVKSLQNERLFIIKPLEFVDPATISASHPDGRTLYVQYIFTASRATTETAYPSIMLLRALDIARKIYKAQLIKDGTLDQQAADAFVLANGMTFSERRRELNPQFIVVPVAH